MSKFEMWRDVADNDTVKFSGELTVHDLAALKLDGIDRMVINSPAETAADHLQSLEIIFRRLHEQEAPDA